ncbi:hypothetical protein EPUL_000152 [Erysiphe pulchra]|uniref:DDE-1 domain-containing protein n=1 Tax=Erysiphe pulchra TaxID=225359 RepID=A0A2S4Q2D8_9PEZI|nr:hypothetical protein EPUL_000152 [Erysiphe pulchra]
MNEYLDHFFEYRNSGPTKPWTMLLLDGRTCHRRKEFLLKAEQNNIYLQVFPSHETHALQQLDALRELDYDYSISSFFRDISCLRKKAFKEKTIKSVCKKSGMWPISCKNTILSRSRYIGQQGKSNGRKRRYDEIESEQLSQLTEFELDNIQPGKNYEAAMLIKEVSIYNQETLGSTFPAAYKEGSEAAHELLLKADHQESQLANLEACVVEQRMHRTKAWKTVYRRGGIIVDQWKARISEKERLENAKAIRKPLEGGSSDIEISFGSQYLDPVASSFDSECEMDDQNQDHLRADIGSLAGSGRSTSPIDHTANFKRLFGSDDT